MKKRHWFFGGVAAYLVISIAVGGFYANEEEEKLLADSLRNDSIAQANKKPASVYLDSLRSTKKRMWRDSLERFYPNSSELSKADSIDKANKANYIKEQRTNISKLKRQYDEVEKTTWYYNSKFTHNNNSNHVSFYFGLKENNVWLRLRMSYYGADWIFFNNVLLSYSGENKEVVFMKNEKETDNSGGYVWEWIDISGDKYENILKRMAEKQEGLVRFSGKYSHDHKLTKTEMDAIIEVLDAYRGLKRLIEAGENIDDLRK